MSVVTELMEAALKAPRKGLLSFHGSPYEFDRFANKYLMKGEGAMARGSGHYSGSSLEGEIAPKYWSGRGTFIGPDPKKPSVSTVLTTEPEYFDSRGRELVTPLQERAINAYWFLNQGIHRTATEEYDKLFGTAAKEYDAAQAMKSKSQWTQENIRKLADSDRAYEFALDKLDDYANQTRVYTPESENYKTIRQLLEGRSVKYNPGRGYALDLQVNPERYLDWNAPIDRQPAYVRDAILSSDNPDVGMALRPNANIGLLQMAESGGQFLQNLEHILGNDRYYNIRHGIPVIRKKSISAQNKARDILMGLGIDYTKYTPIGGGEGTERGVHYIVYDPKKIKILKMLSLAGVTWAADELKRMGMDNQPDGEADESGV